MTLSSIDGGWGWFVVGSAFVCSILIDGIGLSYGVLLPKFSDYFNATKSDVSLVGTVLIGIYSCTGPIHSGLVNKFGCRPVCVFGSLLSATGFFIASFSSSLSILIITYGVIGGTGFGMMYLSSIVCVGKYFKKKRPLATGIAVCGSGVRSFLFSPLFEYLSLIYDWRGTLIVIAGILLHGSVCGMLFRPLNTTENKGKKSKNKETNKSQQENILDVNKSFLTNVSKRSENFKGDETITWRSSLINEEMIISHIDALNKRTDPISTTSDASLKSNTCKDEKKKQRNLLQKLDKIFDFSLYRKVPFILICVGNIFGLGANYIPITYLVDRALLLGIKSSDAAWLLSVIGIMNIVGRLLAGILATTKRINTLILNNVALFIASGALFAFPMFTTYTALLAFCIVYGLCMATFITLAPVLLCEVLGIERFACAFGHLGVARGIASVFVPLSAGILYQNTGNYDASFYFGGGLFMASFIVHLPVTACCLNKTPKQSTKYTVNKL